MKQTSTNRTLENFQVLLDQVPIHLLKSSKTQKYQRELQQRGTELLQLVQTLLKELEEPRYSYPSLRDIGLVLDIYKSRINRDKERLHHEIADTKDHLTRIQEGSPRSYPTLDFPKELSGRISIMEEMVEVFEKAFAKCRRTPSQKDQENEG